MKNNKLTYMLFCFLVFFPGIIMSNKTHKDSLINELTESTDTINLKIKNYNYGIYTGNWKKSNRL